MNDNIIGVMAEMVALESIIIASPIIYQHKLNTVTTTTTETTATTKSLKNYKIGNDILEDAREFVISRNIIVEDERQFLKLEAKRNDTILFENDIWYVATTANEGVHLSIIASANTSSIPSSNATKSYEI